MVSKPQVIRRRDERHQYCVHKVRELTDQQWKILAPLIPEPAKRRDGRGRPWKERRTVLNGILWVFRTGAPWADLPDRYPSYQTCHRRFQQWVRSGVMRGVLEALAADLRMRGVLDVEEAFIDGSAALLQRKKGLQETIESKKLSFHCSTRHPQYAGSIVRLGK